MCVCVGVSSSLQKRPNLRRDLIESDEDDEDESDGESESERVKATGAAAKTASAGAVDDDDVHEELITDGAETFCELIGKKRTTR